MGLVPPTCVQVVVLVVQVPVVARDPETVDGDADAVKSWAPSRLPRLIGSDVGTPELAGVLGT